MAFGWQKRFLSVALVMLSLFVCRSDAYIYCDPFSQARMLKCVCNFLDYANIHMPSSVDNKRPLLCQRYQTYKVCSKSLSVVCRKAVVGSLEKLYDALCEPDYYAPCKFNFSVDLAHCPLKPLCDELHCFVNHGAKATLGPAACPLGQLFLTSSSHPKGVKYTMTGPTDFVCRDEVLTMESTDLNFGQDISAITSVQCLIYVKNGEETNGTDSTEGTAGTEKPDGTGSHVTTEALPASCNFVIATEQNPANTLVINGTDGCQGRTSCRLLSGQTLSFLAGNDVSQNEACGSITDAIGDVIVFTQTDGTLQSVNLMFIDNEASRTTATCSDGAVIVGIAGMSFDNVVEITCKEWPWPG